MVIEQVAENLSTYLRLNYTNIQAVGIVYSNSDGYKQHPEWYAKEIKDDNLIVYTITSPIQAQLSIKEYEGYRVEWKKLGEVVIGRVR